MSRRILSQRCFLGFSFFIVAVIILEVSLQFCGWFFIQIQQYKNRQALAEEDTIRVMCIGESTTAFGGKDAYPVQLQDILNSSSHQARYAVINQGVPAKDTTYIADNLHKWLNEYNPHIVVAMMGINDNYSLVPFKESSGWVLYFKKLRTYKLYQWIRMNLSPADSTEDDRINKPQISRWVSPRFAEMLFTAIDLKEEKKYAEAASTFRWLSKSNFNELFTDRAKRELMDCLYEMNEYRELVVILKGFLSRDSFDFNGAQLIGKMCQENKGVDYVTDVLHELIEAHPNSNRLFNILEACHAQLGDTGKDNRYLTEKGDWLRRDHYDQVTQRNFQKIIGISRDHNIPMIIMQYPFRSLNTVKRMLGTDMDLQHVRFVGNERHFRRALKEGQYNEYFSDRFAGNFGHATQKGNAIIAHNVAQVILQLME